MAKDPFCSSLSPFTTILPLSVPSLFSSSPLCLLFLLYHLLSLPSSLLFFPLLFLLLPPPPQWTSSLENHGLWASPSQAALSMNHSAPLPALDEEPTNLEKSNLTHAGKFPSNLKGKCWCCKGRAGTGDRMGVGGRTGVSLDLPYSGKGDSGAGDTCR